MCYNIFYCKLPGKWIFFGGTEKKKTLKRIVKQLFAEGYWVTLRDPNQNDPAKT